MFGWLQRRLRLRSGLKNVATSPLGFDRIPTRQYSTALRNPLFRHVLLDTSLQEDRCNSYYSGILNKIANDCLGPCPTLLCNFSEDSWNETVEDRWIEWTVNNQIGRQLRKIRRGAARTGIGIGIPQPINDTDLARINLTITPVCASRLVSPRNMAVSDRIWDGIEYDSSWKPVKIYIDNGSGDPKEYAVKDILFYTAPQTEDIVGRVPECGPAFTYFPHIKRFMEAVIKAEEFRASIPLSLHLDPNYYNPKDYKIENFSTFEYDTSQVYVNLPGTELKGIPISNNSNDRHQMLRMMVGAAAKCVDMPLNLAMGDSSNSNMATAQIDIQPWKNRVEIDRIDYEPQLNKLLRWWWELGVNTPGYFPPQVRDFMLPPHRFGYTVLFNHPDPNKVANSVATELVNGSTTLTEYYAKKGNNARRALTKEAALYDMDLQEYLMHLLVVRSRQNLELIDDEDE